jgi:hypothetical protein
VIDTVSNHIQRQKQSKRTKNRLLGRVAAFGQEDASPFLPTTPRVTQRPLHDAADTDVSGSGRITGNADLTVEALITDRWVGGLGS